VGVEIQVDGHTKSFGRQVIWQDVSLTLPAGEISVMLGPSGTGKSVFLETLVGLLKPDRGSVMINGRHLTRLREADLYEVRKLFGVLFQDGALFGSMSLYDNIAFPLREHAVTERGGQPEAVQLEAGQLEAETEGGERGRSRQGAGGWPRGAKASLAGPLVITLSSLAAFGLVAYRVRPGSRVETARDQASAAAQHDVVSILSYDYRHLDRDFAAGRAALTGSFAKDYRATTTKLVRPGATAYHVVVKAEVAAESVVSATAGEVVVLLFVNQTTTSTRLDGPRVDLNRVRLTLVKVDGSWLVNNVAAL
jgi:ABC-type sugar transport system ATPase subunit